MRKILTSALVVLICLTAFITGYCKGCYSYAEDIHYMSDEELEAAYQAYLQSKGGSLIGNAGARLAYTNGKMLNFLTSEANTTPFKNINAVKGLMRWQKSELESGNSSVLQLSMSQGGASVFSLYTQWLLQNHYFGNGVSEDNNGMFEDGTENNLYSGQVFIDADNYYALVFIYSGSDWNNIQKYGTQYKYSTSDIVSGTPDNGNATWTFNIQQNLVKNFYSAKYRSNAYTGYDGITLGTTYNTLNWTNTGLVSGYYFNDGNNSTNHVFDLYGYPAIGKRSNMLNNEFYLGVYTKRTDGKDRFVPIELLSLSNSQQYQNTNVIFYTNNNNNINVYPTINEGDNLYITPKVNVGIDPEINYQPYIINEGDTVSNIVNNYYIDSGTPDKTISIPTGEPLNDNPSGGGGDNPSGNPSGGTPPDWNNPYPNITQDSDGVFNFNFHLPDLNIDWNINGLQEKFPFSIPFDLIRFINVLNAEPQTPEFDFTIDLKIYQWHIEADLHQFDNLAGIVRNVEFIGFCISLVLITRKMIKG